MARTHTNTLIHTYICACERKSALRRARDRDISTGRGLNAMEHEGRHEAKFLKAMALTKPLLLVMLRIIPRKSRYFPQNRGASYNRSSNTVQ